MEQFELTVDELRSRQGIKWSRYPASVLPAWVADMDFKVAEPVQAAVSRLVEHQDYGYGHRTGENSLAATFARRMQERFSWSIEVEQVQPVTELIQAMFASLMVFSEPGDGVVVQNAIYPPFLMSIEKTGRRAIFNPPIQQAGRYQLDIDGLAAAIDARTRMLLFCNPHNPLGRVFDREELTAIGQLAIEHNLIIVSDEIHADLVYDGRRHIPIASLSPEIAARTITLTSATKGFNIAGLRCALMHFGSAALQERFRSMIPDYLLGQCSVAGIDATVAAWRDGQPWLDAVLVRLQANRDRLTAFLADQLPEIGYLAPEGTYLAWLDCQRLGLEHPYQFFLDHGLGFGDGAMFGPNANQCIRLNFATSAPILEEILFRTAAAVGRVGARQS